MQVYFKLLQQQRAVKRQRTRVSNKGFKPQVYIEQNAGQNGALLQKEKVNSSDPAAARISQGNGVGRTKLT